MRIKDALQTSNKHWFEQVLDLQMLKEEREEKVEQIAKNIDHFRPSMVHQCPRAIWYARKGYEAEDNKVSSIKRMRLGTLIHEMIDDVAKKTPHFSSSEEDVEYREQEVYVLGHYDMIVKNPVGEYELMELKSYANPKPNSRYKLVLPKDEHIDQWNFYSYLSSINDELPDTTKGFIMYINKNSQDYEFYNQKRDQRRIDKMLNKLRKIQKYLDKDEHYPYQPDENHNWCNYRPQCEADFFLRGM